MAWFWGFKIGKMQKYNNFSGKFMQQNYEQKFGFWCFWNYLKNIYFVSKFDKISSFSFNHQSIKILLISCI